MGSAVGVQKKWARHLGIPLAEYLARLDAGQKWCGGCKSWHQRGAFGADRSRADGLNARCSAARVVAIESPGVRERRLKTALGSAWCRACRAWLPTPDVHQGMCRPHRNEAARLSYANHRAATAARKSARARGLAIIPPWWREERFAEFGGLCAYGCLRPATGLDHVWPVARGGQSRPDNLVPACIRCNSSKKDSDPEPWLDRFATAFPDHYLNFMDLNCLLSGRFDPDMEVA